MNSFVQSINSDSIARISRGLILSPKLAKNISWLMLLLIIFMVAMFSWSIWDYFQPNKATTTKASVASTKNQSTSVNINKLITYHLFGDPKGTAQIADNNPISAPVTRLKLKLRGVYASTDESLASAMIEASNKQELYRIGSKLPGAAGLKLHKIMSDRVIMSRGGKFETLLIEDFGKLKGSSNSRISSNRRTRTSNSPVRSNLSPSFRSNTIDKRKDANLTKELLKLRSKLSDPQSLSELISVTPANVGGEFKGFRLAPGKNRALFGRLGLRRNDIITSINGISLNDPASAFSLMEQISTADEIDLKLKRGDREMNILFSAQE